MGLNLSTLLNTPDPDVPSVDDAQAAAAAAQGAPPQVPRELIDQQAAAVVQGVPESPFTYEPEMDVEGNITGYYQTPVDPSVVAAEQQRQAQRFAAPQSIATGREEQLQMNPNLLYEATQDPRGRLKAQAGSAGVFTPAGVLKERGPYNVDLSNDVTDHWAKNVDQTRKNLFGNGGVKAQPIIDAWGISDLTQADNLPEAVEISFNNAINDINKYKLYEQTGDVSIEENKKGRKSSVMEKIRKAQGKAEKIQARQGDISQADSIQRLGNAAANPANQPMYRSLVDNIVAGIDSQFSPQEVEGQAVPFAPGNQQNTAKRQAAAQLIDQWTQDGLLSWGVTSDGTVMPIPTMEGRSKAEHAQTIQNIFSPPSRFGKQGQHQNPLVSAQLFVTPKNNLASAIQQAYAKKGGWTDEHGNGYVLSNATTQILSSVFTDSDPLRTGLGQAMFADVQKNIQQSPEGFSYSTSPFAAEVTNGPINEDAVRKVYAEALETSRKRGVSGGDLAQQEAYHKQKAAQEANSYVSTQLAQANRHFNEYAVQGLQQKTATPYDRSQTNARFTMVGTDAQVQAFKGTMRNTFKFSDIPDTSGISPKNIDTLVDKVSNILGKEYQWKGKRSGTGALEELNKLSENDMQLVDTLFVIGSLAANDNGLNTVSMGYGDIIKYGRDNLGAVAERGSILKGFDPATLDMQQIQQHPWLAKLLTNKGEWGFPLSVYGAASELQDAINRSNIYGIPQTAKLNYVVETDSKQSNAILMSVVMGDPTIMDLLSDLLNLTDTPEARDLRTVAASTLTDSVNNEISDVDQIFGTVPSDAGVHKAMTKFFTNAKASMGDKFAKAYARGIACAGLYGKTPWKMTTEIEEFLSKPGVANAANELRNEYIRMFGGKAETYLMEDMGQMFAQSMSRHMGSLQSYQSIMQHIQDLNNASGLITEINSLVPNEKITASAPDVLGNLGAQQVTEIEKQLGLSGQLQPGGYANYQTPDARNPNLAADVEAARRARAGFGEGESANVSYYGEKSRAMVAPTLIHSGDSYGVISTTLAVNESRNGTKLPPAPMKTIHDALLTGPGATLKALIAYNNVFPYLMAERGNNMLANLLDSADTAAAKTIDTVLSAGQPVMIGDNSTRFKSVMGFFDRHFYNLDDDYIDAVIDEDVGERAEFLTERQIARLKHKEKRQAKKRQLKSKAILEIALELGWVPPTKRNVEARKNLEVTADNFATMLGLITEANGLGSSFAPEILPETVGGERISANWIESQLGLNESTLSGKQRAKRKRLNEALEDSNRVGKNMTLDF